jgi:3-oxoacyl-[acyl-carrier protein] reductase
MASEGTGRFAGQVAVVTGAAQGIGFTTAELFAREGAAVALVDIDGGKVEAAAARLAETGAETAAHRADLSSEEEVVSTFERIVEAHGQIDVLVNLASIYPWISLEETTMEDWRQILGANLDSTFLCCRAVVPHMKQRGYGRIVNTSSGTVLIGISGLSAYMATKAAVIGFTRAISREAGEHGVTANVIMPGLIATDHVLRMLDDEPATDEFFRETLAQQCVKRRGRPEDIAHGIAYLASREASFVTGEVLYVSGGYAFH